jgi:hypothetical protein
MQTLAGIWLALFGVGMPIIGFSCLFWMNRTGRLNDPRWRTAFGFLNDGYKPRYYWWEAVVLVRKLLILLVAVVLSPDDGFVQAFGAVVILAFAMILQAWVQPYEYVVVNMLDEIAMLAIFSTRLGAILYNHFDPFEPAIRGVDCRDTFVFDLKCQDGRMKLGGIIAYTLITAQVLLVVLFVGLDLRFRCAKRCGRLVRCMCTCVKEKKLIESVDEDGNSSESSSSSSHEDASSSSASDDDDDDDDEHLQVNPMVHSHACRHFVGIRGDEHRRSRNAR